MKKLELIFIALTIGCSGYAQTIIKGSVFDEKGEALTGANIYIENTYDGASSDINGLFQFKTQAEGLHKLRVEFIGYKPVSTEVNLNGGVVEKTYRMEEAFNQLEAVVITAGSFEAGDKKRAIEMTSLDIATTAGAMGDIVGALNTLPGTTRVGESGRLYVRGGSDEETKTFIDGMLVGAPYFSSAPNLATRGRFNPFLFSGTVFNTGGYSAEYGQALSSVLLLSTTEEKVKDELNLSLLAGLGGDVTATKSWNEGSITASVSYFNMRPYLALVSNNQEWIKPMEMVSQEISLKQRSGKHGMFKWYSNYNSGRFGLEQPDLDNPDESIRFQQQTRTHFFNASWNTTLNEKWYVFSGVSSTLNRDAMTINDDPFGEQVRSTHLKAGADHQFSEKVSIRFGTDYFDQSYINTFSDDVTPSELRISNDLAAVYAEANMYASTRFVVRAGARAEYAAGLDEYTVAPRFSSAFKLDDNSQVSWAYGWFYQLPTNRDLMQSQRLNVERADHFLLSYQRNKNNRMLRGEMYYKRYDDLVSYDGVMPFERTNYSNDGYGYAYGLDVFFRDAKTIKNGHYWISYSYLETERDYQAFPVMTTPTFTSKHNLSVVYKHWLSRWRSMISADFSYASPRPYHDPNTHGFNTARMKSFSSLNASWVYLFKNQVILYASCSNVLGRKNEFGYRFSNTPNDDGLYTKEVIAPFSQRFYVLGIFFTFSKDKTRNQLDKIN